MNVNDPTEKKSYEIVKVNSVNDFLRETSERQSQWERKEEFQADAWFRGVPDIKYVLRPSYYWFKDGHPRIEEDDLRDEFTRRALPLFRPKNPQDKWEWYFLMQHYGLPSRLLDWSESSLVGLFFAAYDFRLLNSGRILTKEDGLKNDDKEKTPRDSAVWMMDPTTLNRWALKDIESFEGRGPLLRHDDPVLTPYLSNRPFEPLSRGDESSAGGKPIAIMPAYTNLRLMAQRGMFVLFGLEGQNEPPLETALDWTVEGDARLIKFEIEAENIPQIRQGLRRAGITASVLFPELPMLCNDILHAWCE